MEVFVSTIRYTGLWKVVVVDTPTLYENNEKFELACVESGKQQLIYTYEVIKSYLDE